MASFGSATNEPLAQRLVHHPQVATVAALLSWGSIYVDGQSVPLMAIEDHKGRLPMAVVEGREPQPSDEIALGSITLRRLGKQVGDTVEVATDPGGTTQRMEVVGRAVLHESAYGFITPGTGGLVHPDLLRHLPATRKRAGQRRIWSGSTQASTATRPSPGSSTISPTPPEFPAPPLMSAPSNASRLCPGGWPRWWPCSPWAP